MSDPDPLDELRARLRETHEAAERLAGEASSARAQEPSPGAGEHARGAEVQAIVALLESLRDLIPPDLRAEFQEVVRQVLLLLRALIDWWVARLEGAPRAAGGPAGPPAQDIPVA